MSRYTDLMKKSERTFSENDELFALILEEFDREERRLSKLPIDEKTRQESLWNVIDAHWDILNRRFKEYKAFLDEDEFGDELESRLWKEYDKRKEDRSRQIDDHAPEEDQTPVNLDEKTKQLLNIPKTTVIRNSDLADAKGQLAVKKCEDAYSVVGDKTISPEQRKALYQFHHWMRKHNATAKIKWSGLGYKGSAVDFSEQFMRLPARVQLKALYLVETDNRKRPNEEIDNTVSQDYVPDYDKLKKKMTSNFLFVRKYLNGSRYLWNKLEQAANLANDDRSVEKLKQFTDARRENKAVKASDFFLSKDSGLDFMKQLRAQVDRENLDYDDGIKDGKSRKQRKEERKQREAGLKDYALLIKSIYSISEFKEKHKDTDGDLEPQAQKELEKILKSIDNVRKNLLDNKRFLEDYQNYFNKQSGDLTGYTALGTGLGTAMYELLTKTPAHPYICASVSLATLPTALMNCLDAVRTMFNGEGAAEKTMGVMDLLSGTAVAGSKGITALNLVTEVGTTATNVGMYLGTGAFGMATAVNAVKSARSYGKKRKADDLYKSFQTLNDKLQNKIDDLSKNEENRETVENLQDMKKKTLWKTLENASKLIKRDKKRELNSNLRNLAASALSCISSAVGYVGNTILSWCGVGGSGVGGLGGTINQVCDNLAAKERSSEYIETEYPITNEQRIVAIQNYKKQQEKYKKDSKEWKEIQEFLSDKKKLDNRIRNMQAGNHVRANQEGLRNAIYQQYSSVIAEETLQSAQFEDDGSVQDIGEQNIPLEKEQKEKLTAGYEKEARQLMTGYSELLGLKKTDEKKQGKAVKVNKEADRSSVKSALG